MNFIEKKAQKLVDYYLSNNNIGNPKNLLQNVNKDLIDVDSEEDKTAYLTIILEANDLQYNEHLKVCKNIDSCSENDAHEEVNYFLHQELIRIGVRVNEDVFTREEKETLTDSLNKFASDLKDLKDGQQVIYDDLLAEIQELKKWFILGKKNWRQLAVGKAGEMVVGGVISEATAKPLFEMIKSGVTKLIEL
ncbi:hypothetical protein D3C87_39350 [compost metagenome]